jgi:hypothetical protein
MILANGGLESATLISEQTNPMGTNGLKSVGSVNGQQAYLSKPGLMRANALLPGVARLAVSHYG